MGGAAHRCEAAVAVLKGWQAGLCGYNGIEIHSATAIAAVAFDTATAAASDFLDCTPC